MTGTRQMQRTVSSLVFGSTENLKGDLIDREHGVLHEPTGGHKLSGRIARKAPPWLTGRYLLYTLTGVHHSGPGFCRPGLGTFLENARGARCWRYRPNNRPVR